MSAIHDKIRKLLALGEGKANENEAAQAMKLASDLMMKHGIERSELTQTQKAVIVESDYIDFRDKWHLRVGNAVASLMGCKMVYRNRHKQLRFVGRKDNCEATELVYSYILLQIEQFYREALPSGMTQKDRANFRKSFKYAAAVRVAKRCWDIVNDQGLSATGSTALVVHRNQLSNEITDFWNQSDKTPKDASIKQPVLHSQAGINLGLNAGDLVEINRTVN